MYEKNLTEDLRLRLSTKDMDFLRELSEQRSVSLSEVIRSIIAEYRRSVETLNIMTQALKIAQNEQAKKEAQNETGGLSHGDTKTDFHDKL